MRADLKYETTNWKAGCLNWACPVWREGQGSSPVPTPIWGERWLDRGRVFFGLRSGFFGFGGIRHPNDAASDACPGISDRLAAVIRFGMDDDSSAENRILYAGNGDIFHCDLIVGMAMGISLNVTQVASVTVIRFRQGVRLILRVVMAPRAHGVRSCAIAELMNVKSVLLVGSKTFDMSCDFDRVAHLGEHNLTVTFVSSGGMQNGDSFFNGGPGFTVSMVSREKVRRSGPCEHTCKHE